MSDYRAMYLKMARASEEAIAILIQAQQEAEEIYISQPEVDLRLVQPTDGEAAQVAP